ncbi:hypothetical protein BJ508DRAFT_362809 [Ascobolus immersus RN42]|uniref:Ecp2 effector protein domain-containing protein n=1 Tax=Ascobolus immersus RN42 TaxID=1160509 RepID=A0A3N4I264_ASCIM|nr:hypothetical protein BJ508DRAFT_362809 [Ascobolus immersus RN42]
MPSFKSSFLPILLVGLASYIRVAALPAQLNDEYRHDIDPSSPDYDPALFDMDIDSVPPLTDTTGLDRGSFTPVALWDDIKCESSMGSARLNDISAAVDRLRQREKDGNCLQSNYGGSKCTDFVNVNGAQIGICGAPHIGAPCGKVADVAWAAAVRCRNKQGRAGAQVWFRGLDGKKVRLILH